MTITYKEYLENKRLSEENLEYYLEEKNMDTLTINDVSYDSIEELKIDYPYIPKSYKGELTEELKIKLDEFFNRENTKDLMANENFIRELNISGIDVNTFFYNYFHTQDIAESKLRSSNLSEGEFKYLPRLPIYMMGKWYANYTEYGKQIDKRVSFVSAKLKQGFSTTEIPIMEGKKSIKYRKKRYKYVKANRELIFYSVQEIATHFDLNVRSLEYALAKPEYKGLSFTATINKIMEDKVKKEKEAVDLKYRKEQLNKLGIQKHQLSNYAKRKKISKKQALAELTRKGKEGLGSVQYKGYTFKSWKAVCDFEGLSYTQVKLIKHRNESLTFEEAIQEAFTRNQKKQIREHKKLEREKKKLERESKKLEREKKKMEKLTHSA